MRNLTATAAANSALRGSDAAALMAADSSGRLERFHDLVVRSDFSTNVTAEKILAYDAAGRILDTRRVYEHYGMTTFDSDQGEWLRGRQAFEGFWAGGDRIVYGVVNVGGMGVEGKHGTFCLLVADPTANADDGVAVFPGNTAERYITSAGTPDEERVVAEATRWEDRAALAVIERHGEVLDGDDEEGWSAVVCSQKQFLEASWITSATLSAIGEVRLRLAERRRLHRLWSRAAADLTLSDTERNEAAAYDAIMSWRKQHPLLMTEVSAAQ